MITQFSERSNLVIHYESYLNLEEPFIFYMINYRIYLIASTETKLLMFLNVKITRVICEIIIEGGF